MPVTTSATPQAGWNPTASNLLVLIALEIVAYVALRYTFRIVHGG